MDAASVSHGHKGFYIERGSASSVDRVKCAQFGTRADTIDVMWKELKNRFLAPWLLTKDSQWRFCTKARQDLMGDTVPFKVW